MSRFGFASPSSAFLRVFFLSIRETLSCSCAGEPAGRDSVFCGAGVRAFPGAAAGAVSSVSCFFGTFSFDAATGLSAAAGLRVAPSDFGAVLRIAVLLLVFVAIVA
jgi:hypothetical protein